MSTKATIAHGLNFHLYHNMLDEDYIYLELQGVPFEASYQRVMVPIPVHIWEVIRHYPSVDLSFADKTDDELRQYVEQEVDERLKEYHDTDEKARRLVALLGLLAFGAADQPREEQIAVGIDYFMKLRDHRRQIKQAITELEQMNKRT